MTKKFIAVVGIVAFLGIFQVHSAAAESFAEKEGMRVAENFLYLIDAGNIPEAWDSSSGILQSRVGRKEWSRKIEGVRDLFGGLVERTLLSAKVVRTYPEAPDGQYVVIVFQSTFANKQKAVEIVTPRLGPDGQWRVLSYIIK